MKTHVIGRVRPARPREPKYAPYLQLMRCSLEEDGADGQTRAVDGSRHWSKERLRKTVQGIRDLRRRQPVKGYRLSLARCSVNGLCFRWVTEKEAQ